MNTFSILILDPRGVISVGENDVIERHSNYGKELEKQSKKLDYRLKIFSASTKQISASQSNKTFEILNISKPTFNSYKFAKSAHKYIESNKVSVKLFVVGDPWESFWSAYFLNKFLNKKVPIQIQVHGDIADPRWRRINLRNRIRFSLAKLSLPKASSVRAVTKYQSENLIMAFGIKRERIVVVPVPINILGKSVPIKSERPKTIGLIGRIHQDRGIWEFIKLIRNLNSS
jgi:glycosyltransferase involved in cell wall biosynthesis